MAAFGFTPACAGDLASPLPAPGHSELLPLNFDIAQRDERAILAHAAEDDSADEVAEEGALDEPELPLRPWDDDGLKREWSIQPNAEGPALEVAALGGGRKKSGRLAHVRVSWAF